MKLIWFILMLISSNMLAQSSAYQKFEWDIIQLGIANTTELVEVKTGLVLGSEIRYNIRDNSSIGIESEFSFYFSDISDDDNFDVNLLATGSFVYDRYLKSNTSKRAFYGVGFGQYTSMKILVREGEERGTINEFTSLGFSGRLGYEFGRWRIKGQYTINTRKEVVNYLVLKIGFTLGGKYLGN